MDKSIYAEMLELGEDGNTYIIGINQQGEVISRTIATVMPNMKKRPNQYFKKGEFLTMSKLMMKMLKGKKNYSNLTFRLLFELMERIEFNNRIRTFRQNELAETLEAQQPHISSALKILENDSIIEKREHDYYFTKQFIRFASDEKETADERKKK